MLHVTSESARLRGGGTITDSAQILLDAGTTWHLIFDQSSTIENSATFMGAGELVVAELATAIFQSGATTAATLRNQGGIEIGTSPGTLNIEKALVQDPSGLLEMEIGG